MIKGDFNNDGKLDLAVSSSTTNLRIFYNMGNAIFESSKMYLVGNDPGYITSGFIPAGVSGSPINLALGSILNESIGMITLTVNNVPRGWTLNNATPIKEDTWVIHTYEPESLTITPSIDFVGSRALPIEVVWIGLDGKAHQTIIMDNVEVYAINCPIFALPGDNLSGSVYSDTFVIEKSLSLIEDTIFNFDIQKDKLHFLDFDTHQFSDLSIHKISEKDCRVALDNEYHSVLLHGVHPDSLMPYHFLFDEAPYTFNENIIDVGLGTIMPFKGILENEGIIRIDGTMVMEGILKGSGHIIMGPLGVLEFKGELTQDLIFETHLDPIIFHYNELTLTHIASFSLQAVLDNTLPLI